MKKILFQFSLLFCLGLACVQPTGIHADELEPNYNVQIEINDIQVGESIKSQLFEQLLDDSSYPNIKDQIDIVNSEIKIENLDITTLGSQDVTIHMNLKTKVSGSNLLFNNLFSGNVNVNVVDTTAPEISLKYPAIRLDYKEELDPYEWIASTSDNSNSEITSLYAETTSLDITTPGNYTVYYYATDQSGNVGVSELSVKVKDKVVVNTNYGTNSDSISAMLNLINNARADAGLSALTLGNSNAQAAIGVRAAEAAGYVSHTRPDGRHYKTAFDDYNVSYSHPYEVLTYSGTSVQDKFNWWMNSSGHKAILLRSSGTKIAIGYSGKMWAAIVYN